MDYYRPPVLILDRWELQQRVHGSDLVTDLSRSGRIAAVVVGTGWNGEAPESR
jgi:hypothetical protein